MKWKKNEANLFPVNGWKIQNSTETKTEDVHDEDNNTKQKQLHNL